MKAATVSIALLCAALAACSGPTAAPTTNTAATATPDPMEAKIAALSPQQQRATFFRAIYDGGYTCQKIIGVKEQPRGEDGPVWVATCEDGGNYVLMLKPGGIFSVSGVPQPGTRN